MERIKEIRQNLGLSRAEFSELYEIPYNTLAQWERGERQAPGYTIKLIEHIIKLRTKGEPMHIEDKIIFCNVKTASRLDGEYRTYYTNEEEANKEINFYETKMHGYSLKREIYKRIQ